LVDLHRDAVIHGAHGAMRDGSFPTRSGTWRDTATGNTTPGASEAMDGKGTRISTRTALMVMGTSENGPCAGSVVKLTGRNSRSFSA
jgi:hypothetical protein